MTGLWDRLLEEYDQLVHIPMSSGLSGSCQTAMALAQDYEGKVFVVNNHRISVTQRQSALDAKMLADAGKTGEGDPEDSLRHPLRIQHLHHRGYPEVSEEGRPDHPGGRSSAARFCGSSRCSPSRGSGWDAFAKARTMKQAKDIMLTALKKDLEERFHDKDCRKTWLQIAHTANGRRRSF